jgi:hypothetical protein
MATILVVEDTLTESEIITGTLRKAGFTTVAVANSEDAKQQMRSCWTLCCPAKAALSCAAPSRKTPKRLAFRSSCARQKTAKWINFGE